MALFASPPYHTILLTFYGPLIYNITKALWNDESRKLLDVGHAKGKTITPATALNGVGVPLHAGAERFYKEAGLLK